MAPEVALAYVSMLSKDGVRNRFAASVANLRMIKIFVAVEYFNNNHTEYALL